MKIFYNLSLIIVLFSCTENQKENVVSNFDDKIFVEDDENSQILEEDEEEDIFYHKELRALIYAGNYNTYDENFKPIGKLEIEKTKEIKIIKITDRKYPENEKDDYCNWANFIQIINQSDTLIIFGGGDILEITNEYKNLHFTKENFSLILAHDFLTEAGDEEGLTGCDDFEYMLISTSDGNYFSIYPNEKNFKSFASLISDDGMFETIESMELNNDTLEIKILVGYQDGAGAYTMKIFKENEKWKFVERDKLGDKLEYD